MRNIRWQKMALRAANGLLDGVTALLVLLAVVWSGYALWDNSRVYAAADNVQAGLLAFKPQPQEDNSLSFGQLRDINPDVCGWLTLDGTAIDYPVVQGESNFTYLNTDVYGSFALAGSIFLDVDCDADFSGRYSLLYGHHMENGRIIGWKCWPALWCLRRNRPSLPRASGARTQAGCSPLWRKMPFRWMHRPSVRWKRSRKERSFWRWLPARGSTPTRGRWCWPG